MQTAGSGQNLLSLHAGVADSRMWRSQMALDGYRSIVFDQRGFGKTPWVPDSYADWRDAVAVMDQLEVESATVVGCSLGGGIAMHLALAAPERVDGLVLIGAAARGWEPKGGWPDDPRFDEAEAAAKAGDLARIVELDASIWLTGEGRTLDDIDPDLVNLFLEMDRIPATTEAERNEYAESFDPPTNGRLSDISLPTLVMVGAHDVPDLIESANYLADRLSDHSVVVIKDSAHLPSFEQPESFNAALLAFLNS